MASYFKPFNKLGEGLLQHSLKTKLMIFYGLLVLLVVVIKISSLHYFQLPQLYALEAISDKKDVNRVKTAFISKSKELAVLNYDNAVWDDTYNFVNDQNNYYIESNFVNDTYVSLGIDGIHIYNKHDEIVWHRAWDKKNWSDLPFKAFDKPSEFVKNHILISANEIIKNKNKPVTKAGFTFVDDKLIFFSATSIFKSELQGSTNGTMLFWRFFDDELLNDLQKRAGINFSIELITNDVSKKTPLSSLSSSIKNSYRTEKGEIFDVLPFVTGNGSIKFTYSAPSRQFSTSWLNLSTLVTSMLFLLTLLMIFVFFHYVIINPLLSADTRVRKILKNNDHSIRFNSKRKDEIGTMFYLIDRLLDGVQSNTQELTSHNIRLQKISKTDSLTKISNRRAFDDYMKNLIDISADDLTVSMLVCDVDFFKKYNDSYGHNKGDKTLHSIAQTLKNNLHEDTDFVARYGGEEFVVVLKGTNNKNALAVANNLIKAVVDLNISHNMSDIADHVTLSVGVHTFNISDEQQYMTYFQLADKALYNAKNTGRNQAISTE